MKNTSKVELKFSYLQKKEKKIGSEKKRQNYTFFRSEFSGLRIFFKC